MGLGTWPTGKVQERRLGQALVPRSEVKHLRIMHMALFAYLPRLQILQSHTGSIERAVSSDVWVQTVVLPGVDPCPCGDGP